MERLQLSPVLAKEDKVQEWEKKKWKRILLLLEGRKKYHDGTSKDLTL